MIQLKSDLRDLSWTTNPSSEILLEKLRRLQQDSSDLLLSAPLYVDDSASLDADDKESPSLNESQDLGEERDDDLMVASVESASGMYGEVVMIDAVVEGKIEVDQDETLEFD